MPEGDAFPWYWRVFTPGCLARGRRSPGRLAGPSAARGAQAYASPPLPAITCDTPVRGQASTWGCVGDRVGSLLRKERIRHVEELNLDALLPVVRGVLDLLIRSPAGEGLGLAKLRDVLAQLGAGLGHPLVQ